MNLLNNLVFECIEFYCHFFFHLLLHGFLHSFFILASIFRSFFPLFRSFGHHVLHRLLKTLQLRTNIKLISRLPLFTLRPLFPLRQFNPMVKVIIRMRSSHKFKFGYIHSVMFVIRRFGKNVISFVILFTNFERPQMKTNSVGTIRPCWASRTLQTFYHNNMIWLDH